jgi:hypothetical protein
MKQPKKIVIHHEWTSHMGGEVKRLAKCSRCGLVRRLSAVNRRFEYYTSGVDGVYIGPDGMKCR